MTNATIGTEMRYAVILELVEQCRLQETAIGKTALQKLVYFLQELYGVDCGYDFTLYTYGPFSSQLLSDLDLLAFRGGVEVSFDGMGYQIVPGPASSTMRSGASDFLAQNRPAIVEVIEKFSRKSAKYLELLATTIYAQRDAASSGNPPTVDDLVSVVHGLKPHFDPESIRSAINELKGLGFIATS
jgi:uncharacterized protein YwgA